MAAPPSLRSLLGEDGWTAWRRLAPIIPSTMYLGGGTALAAHLRHRGSRDLDFFFHGDTVDLDALAGQLSRLGEFSASRRARGTLNGLFGATPVQFLQAGLDHPERQLEPSIMIEGVNVAGLDDLLAMKLNAIVGRAQLRDYFDLMTIEQRTGRSVEEGITLFVARYRPDHPMSAVSPILRALGFLDDAGEDPFLPASRDEIGAYWKRRQPEIAASVQRT